MGRRAFSNIRCSTGNGNIGEKYGAKVESDSVTKVYTRPTALTIGDVNYPPNIMSMWSASELEAIGIYQITVDSTNLKDSEYYINTDITYTYSSGAVTGTYGSATAKPLVDSGSGVTLVRGLKTAKKEIINNKANSRLTKYDWYTLREASGGTEAPSAVTTYQAAVRTKANTMCTAVDNASDVDALAALYTYNSDDPPTRPLGEFPSKPS